MFKITSPHKSGPSGFHITFANGWTASVQWGEHARADHCPEGATTAEVWAWNVEEDISFGDPLNNQTPAEVLSYLVLIAGK